MKHLFMRGSLPRYRPLFHRGHRHCPLLPAAGQTVTVRVNVVNTQSQ